MSDRTGATVGFVCSGLATWIALDAGLTTMAETLAVLTAALAMGSFLLRRHDLVDSDPGALLAGVFALLTAGAGVVAMSTGQSGSRTLAQLDGSIVGPALVVVLAIASLAAAWIDRRGLERDRVLGLSGRSATAAAIGVGGILSIVIWGTILASVVAAVGVEELTPVTRVMISTVALGLGTASVAAVVLVRSDRSLDFVDAAVPDRRGWIYVVVGTVVLVGANLGIEFLFSVAGVESTTHSLLRTARESPEILLVLIPLSYLVVGPGEELLYRNVVQKYLAEQFSTPAAIVVASIIFAGVHLPAYADPNGTVLALLNTLSVIFVLSLVLGLAYVRTGNVVVSALVHGSFNAIAFTITYLELTNVVGVLTDGCLT